MSTTTEVTELWLAFKKGDKEAFNRLASLFYQTLYSYGTKLTPDRGLVEDCIQDLFFELWQRRTFLGATEHVKFYLLKALRRKIYHEKKTQDKWNAQAVEAQDEQAFVGEFSVEKNIIDLETSELHLKKLHHVLAKLSKRQREIIYLKFYQEMDYEQIANVMSINYQSVRNLLHTALRELKEAWVQEP
ncbi:sigma-70 family RNA polymerase sigma factor [Rhabdobacter roseus]|uniref:RNA polymerase sigma factor (Sigma-70 family) n=1 Tax=Rhabdobacter roseus TaxID=1655419 RepID=A0A840TPI0_9BACT|nr:sigma-70 family RNA polymerase sigma factor [Rhabdobacter roseus]MBB5285671.1 RNA polymerase sigma factor (sigma-70 family) [Rhabdobacter roseus]